MARRESQQIHYIGRNDFQIKIRGLRVELGEIEAHAMRFPGYSRQSWWRIRMIPTIS